MMLRTLQQTLIALKLNCVVGHSSMRAETRVPPSRKRLHYRDAVIPTPVKELSFNKWLVPKQGTGIGGTGNGEQGISKTGNLLNG